MRVFVSRWGDCSNGSTLGSFAVSGSGSNANFM